MKTTSFRHALTRPVVSLAALALAGAALLALAPAAHAHGSERMSAHGAAHPMHGGKHGRMHDGGSSDEGAEGVDDGERRLAGAVPLLVPALGLGLSGCGPCLYHLL